MAEWSHRCCERCWFDGPELFLPQRAPDEGVGGQVAASYELFTLPAPGQKEDGTFKMPVQVKEIDPGACCYCGGLTITAIFTRHDQDELLCKGRHAPEEVGTWSRVTLSAAPSGETAAGIPDSPSAGTEAEPAGGSSSATE